MVKGLFEVESVLGKRVLGTEAETAIAVAAVEDVAFVAGPAPKDQALELRDAFVGMAKDSLAALHDYYQGSDVSGPLAEATGEAETLTVEDVEVVWGSLDDMIVNRAQWTQEGVN